MSKKYALLIGVGSYAEDSYFKPLQTPSRNVAELAKTLRDDRLGAFEVVECVDPDLATMNGAIADLFYGKSKDDFLLLYFSGHGAQDAQRQLYFTNKNSRKYSPDELNLGTVTSANTLKSYLGNHFYHRVVLIFDCCFSGAFGEGILAMDDRSIDLEANLLTVEKNGEKSPPQQGKGRIVLTATDGMGYALEKPDEHHLSVYTRYLVEGLETGVAGDDGAEWISAQALHHYVCDRVQNYNLKPRIFCEGDASQIYLARVCLADPQLEFRKRCQKAFDSEMGDFDPASRRSLRRFAALRDLSTEQAERIMAEVRQPWLDYQENLQEFRETVAEQVAFYGGALPERGRQSLEKLRLHLKIEYDEANSVLQTVFDTYSINSSLGIETKSKENRIIDLKNKDTGKNLTKIVQTSSRKISLEQEVISFEFMDSKFQAFFIDLEMSLKNKNWVEADKQTFMIIAKKLDRVGQNFLKSQIKLFPKKEFRIIDSLWQKYSMGKFGFSVQIEIYNSCVQQTNNLESAWNSFCRQVGWMINRKKLTYQEIVSSEKFEIGCFPICIRLRCQNRATDNRGLFLSFLERL